jgi:hypothetical protein
MEFNLAFKRLIQLSSWGWAELCSKHLEDSNKHIIEEIVRKFGYLPELYEDARPEKYKIYVIPLSISICDSSLKDNFWTNLSAALFRIEMLTQKNIYGYKTQLPN